MKQPKRLRFLSQKDSLKFRELKKSLNIHDVFIDLLVQRGIDNFNSAKAFFRPELEHLYDPFLMKGCFEAVGRISQAIQKNEKILIYGDYDVDGTTAVAMMYSFFTQDLKYDNTAFYIPDRYSEGYGVSFKGVDFAADNDFSLIISLDCGVKSVDKVEYAKSKNIDFIICDHHLPGEIIPDAVAMLNPKQPGCDYPFKELCGCGIGFKLIQALVREFKLTPETAFQYLDLAAISACSDIVPLVDENRILVYYGLKYLNESPRAGILNLLKLAGKSPGTLTVEDVVFIIGPRINAAGRLKHGSLAVELLCGKAGAELLEQSENINKNNTERRELDKTITKQALDQIALDQNYHNKVTSVVYHPEWHKGVVGIVASRLIETHYKPTIVLTKSNDRITGSARTIKNFDLYNAIDKCADLLENYGGHTHAAGLTMLPQNLEAFMQRFNEEAQKLINPEMLIPEIEVDGTIELGIIQPAFYNLLKQFSPFGPGNMNPVFYTQGVKLYNDDIKILKEEHLQFTVIDPKTGAGPFRCIAFKCADYYNFVRNSEGFDICYHLVQHVWKDNVSLQLDVKEIN